MKKSLTQSHGYDSDDSIHILEQIVIIPTNLGTTTSSSEKKEPSWFAGSETPADLSIQVEQSTYNVHKFPLISRCGYIGRIDMEPSISNFGFDLKFDNFPGGSQTFETILKFCYGFPVDLNPNNVAPLRCASEYLEMTEELEDGNLISKTEAFLTFVILSSWRDSITVLKSCDTLSPWAENLQIVRRCCDSIASKAPIKGELIDESWWFDTVATLCIDHFMKIIRAITAKGFKPEIVGSCIMHYAERWLPGIDADLERLKECKNSKNKLQLCILSGKREESSNREQKMIIESLVSILPLQKEAVSCEFLLRLLKTAVIYSVTPALISDLEKRVGMVLEDASVNDLLIPRLGNGEQGKMANSPEECSIHDIDMVQRIMDFFLMHEQQQKVQQKSEKSNISQLLDNYLSEVARDPKLSITKFKFLAETLPANARICHDGLYRAIDVYLKTHPSLTEHDRRRLCKIMDCEKFTVDASMHAAQNDRLPLRTVIQVVLSEQVKMRSAKQEKDLVKAGEDSDSEGRQTSTTKEIKTLKAELESIKIQMSEMQRDYSHLQQEHERLNGKQRKNWALGWKKIMNTGLFHSKVDEDETVGRRISLRRRLTMS